MASHLQRADVLDPDGEKIGTVGEVWLEEGSHDPTWVSVHTGLFGMKESFVPLQGAEAGSGALHVSVRKDQVKDAPKVNADGRLSSAEERELYEHYGMARDGRAGRAPAPRDGGQARRDRSADTELTRSEERLRVGTQTEETGHVRLRRYVVTEDQQVTVPVRHEEVRVEREPIAEGSAGGDATISEEQRDVTLHAERPVVGKETVPVERVRLGTETVTEEQTVRGEVRKEQIDVDRDDSGRPRDERRRRS
ncbi:MAG TPA: PRC and DUF2382 domain-containing protein [Pseudonocardiaceae bacterium]|jgi:uncharacterized protein (TIGR02271 family)|nr:PRC and DUF2382 domain-containing protein [Pseudonocardiaceae bacterium]